MHAFLSRHSSVTWVLIPEWVSFDFDVHSATVLRCMSRITDHKYSMGDANRIAPTTSTAASNQHHGGLVSDPPSAQAINRRRRHATSYHQED